jgi:lipopolysaccharide/colanic/teichoic acid biosynthesis glycosyltransferase
MANSNMAVVEQRLNKFTLPAEDLDSVRQHEERVKLLQELDRRFAICTKGSSRQRSPTRFLRKKLMWATVIGSARLIKRGVDILIAAATLLMLSPILVIIGLCIKLTDGGPILDWPTRLGRKGCEFPYPVFRTIAITTTGSDDECLDYDEVFEALEHFEDEEDAEDSEHGELQSSTLTWIGRIIQRMEIHELPQLLCVLRGHMSLVGSRPQSPLEVQQHLDEHHLHRPTPGLTWIWQTDMQDEHVFDQQVELDLQFLESQSFWLDAKLLLQMVPSVLLGNGGLLTAASFNTSSIV